MKNFITTLLMIAGLAGLVLACSSCACWTDETKRNTPGCIVARDIVDCTVGAIKEYGPTFAKILAGIITGGIPADQIDWDHIVKQAEAMGIKDAGCILAELKDMLFNTQGAGPEFMAKRKAVANVLDNFKMKHFGTLNVKFKIVDRSGKTVEM